MEHLDILLCTLTHHEKSFSHPRPHAHAFICINMPCLTLAYVHILCSHMLFHTSYTRACMHARYTVMQPRLSFNHAFTHSLTLSHGVSMVAESGLESRQDLVPVLFQECGKGRLCPLLPLRTRSCRGVHQSSLQGKGGIWPWHADLPHVQKDFRSCQTASAAHVTSHTSVDSHGLSRHTALKA